MTRRCEFTKSNFSTILRNWETNSLSVIVASSSCQTQLRGSCQTQLRCSDFCARWWIFARSKNRELRPMKIPFASAHQFWFLHILMFALTMFWVARDDLPISEVGFVSRVWLMPSVGSSLAIVTVAASTCLSGLEVDLGHLLQEPISSVVLCLSCSPNPLHGNRNVLSRREYRDPPGDRDDGTGGDRGNRGKMTRARRRFMRELTDLEDALPEMSFVMMHVCRMMWLLCCRWQRSEGEWSPIHAIRKRVNSSWRTSIFMTIQIGTILDCSSGQSMRLPGSSSLLTVTRMRRDLRIIQGCECLLLGGGEMPVEFNRGWILNELSELVREGRNLVLCAQTSMGLTHDRDLTMMWDLSGRLFSVPPLTMEETSQTSDCSKTPCVTSCSCESYTITRPDHSRWHLLSDKRTTSAIASRTVGSSFSCVWTWLDENGNWPNWSMEVWFSCCTARRCLDEGSTRFDDLTWRRVRCRAKNAFERPDYGCEQSRWRHAAFTWWSSKNSWWDLLSGRRRKCWQEENHGVREPPDDLRTHWVEYDARWWPTKFGETSPVRQFLRSPRIGPLMTVGLPCCTW